MKIVELITRINNGISVNQKQIIIPITKDNYSILFILYQEGFLRIKTENKKLIVTPTVKFQLCILSTSGRSRNITHKEIRTQDQGTSFSIIRTSKGIMTSMKALKQNLGGELLCTIKYVL